MPAARIVMIRTARPSGSVQRSARAGIRCPRRRRGDQLESMLGTFRPDLVILDVMLPGRDGFALLDVVAAPAEAQC